jgi:hypothetical protein
LGIVVNPVSIGHISSLDSPQNGQVTPCGTSFIPLRGPETLNVFRHFVQVTIFSILISLLLFSSAGLSGFRLVVVTLPGLTPGTCRWSTSNLDLQESLHGRSSQINQPPGPGNIGVNRSRF